MSRAGDDAEQSMTPAATRLEVPHPLAGERSSANEH